MALFEKRREIAVLFVPVFQQLKFVGAFHACQKPRCIELFVEYKKVSQFLITLNDEEITSYTPLLQEINPTLLLVVLQLIWQEKEFTSASIPQ